VLTCPVALITHVSDAVKRLGLNQLSNALHQISLVGAAAAAAAGLCMAEQW
jgi:hypothetical protein